MNDIFPREFDEDFMRTAESPSKSSPYLRAVIIAAFMAALTALISWYLVAQYNELQRRDEAVDVMWGQVVNQYVRRADLVPNLVVVVKAYATHESKLIAEITEARSRLMALSKAATNNHDPKMLDDFQKAQNRLSAPLSKLLSIAENYPELKANDLFRDLMVQLEGTENRISYARQEYIFAVADYNLALRTFPSNLIAARTGSKPRPKFAVENQSSLARAPDLDLK